MGQHLSCLGHLGNESMSRLCDITNLDVDVPECLMGLQKLGV